MVTCVECLLVATGLNVWFPRNAGTLACCHGPVRALAPPIICSQTHPPLPFWTLTPAWRPSPLAVGSLPGWS